MLFQFFFKYTMRLSIVLIVGLLPYSVFANDLLASNPTPIVPEEKFKSVVPSLMGLTVPEVLQLLPQYDLSLGVVTEIMDAHPDNANKVIQQSVTEGSEVKRLSPIDISVAIANSVTTAAANPIQKEVKASEVKTSEVKASNDTASENHAIETTLEQSAEPLSLSKTKDRLSNTASDDELPIEIPLDVNPTPVALPLKTTDKPSDPKPEANTTKSPEKPIEIDATNPSTNSFTTAEKSALVEKTDKEPEPSITEPSITEKKTDIVVDKTHVEINSSVDKKPVKEDLKEIVVDKTHVEVNSSVDKKSVKEDPKEEVTALINNVIKANVDSVVDSVSESLNQAIALNPETKKSDTEQQDNSTAQPEKEIRNESSTTTSTTSSKQTSSNQSNHQYSGHKLRVSISPSEVQVSREITMEIQIEPPIKSDNLVYQFNLSGKSYTRKSPVFTHVFEQEGKTIITGSARILGKPWIHSASQRINIAKYVAKKIKVPNIVGLSEQAATALLESKGLLVGNIQEKIVKGGQGVITQMPAAGSIRSEDDNKIHYVKAIDEKFQVSITPPRGELDTDKATTLSAQVHPKAKKVRYRFLVNGSPYFSPSAQWKHTFTKAGKNTVVVEAIVAGEGTFVSPAIHFSVAEAWHLPKAVISPFTVTIAQGKNVTFKSASSYDRRGQLNLTWQNTQGESLHQAALLVNTKDLKEGEHIIKLRIKDEKGHESTATAQLIVTAATTNKPEPNADANSDVNSDINSDPKKVEETNKLVEKAVDAALALENSQHAIDDAIAEQNVTQHAQAAAQQKSAAEAKRLALMNDAAQLEQRLNNEPTEILEVTVPDTEKVAVAILPIQAITVKSQRIVAESPNSTAKLTVNIGIWLLSILIILGIIFWILRKSIKSSHQDPIEEEMKAEIPESPYKRAQQRAKTRSANRKTKIDPHLVDFELGKKSQQASSKKNNLSDFKLDD